MGLREGLVLLILIVVGVYVGNMWSHKMIKEQERKEAEYARLLAASQQPTT